MPDTKLAHYVEGHKDGKRAEEWLKRLGIPYEKEIEITYKFTISSEHNAELNKVFE